MKLLSKMTQIVVWDDADDTMKWRKQQHHLMQIT